MRHILDAKYVVCFYRTTRGWIKNLESQSFVALPLLDDESGWYDVAKDLEFV